LAYLSLLHENAFITLNRFLHTKECW